MGLKTTVKKSGSFLSFNFMAMSVGFFTEYWSCNRWHCVSACKTISFFPGSKRSVPSAHSLMSSVA